MIVPMRRFDLNVTETFLADLGNGVAVLLMIFGVGVVLRPGWFEARDFWGGLLACATFGSGLLLGLGSGGIRQNRAVLDMSLRLMGLEALAWLALGIWRGAWLSIVAGLLIGMFAAACWILRREGTRSRFIPRYFTMRQFETMIQIADAMLDADDLKLSPIDVAIRTDHLLAEVDSPIKDDIKQVMFLIEWLTPFLVLRPFPFSDLGTHERRRIIRKVIWSRGLFRDVSRTLKLLSTFTYYTAPDVRTDLGYVDFDDRERAQGLDQSLHVYPVPPVPVEPEEVP